MNEGQKAIALLIEKYKIEVDNIRSPGLNLYDEVDIYADGKASALSDAISDLSSIMMSYFTNAMKG